jgi:hypothetical protein
MFSTLGVLTSSIQFFSAAVSPDHADEIESRIAELGIIAKK